MRNLQMKSSSTLKLFVTTLALLLLTGCQAIARSTDNLIPNNMESCTEEHNNDYAGQADLRGVLPGVTTDEQFLEHFTLPDDSYTSLNQNRYQDWVFTDQQTGWEHFVRVGRKLVILVGYTLPANGDNSYSVGSILAEFGCPDAVVAIKGDKGFEQYEFVQTFLIYMENGFWAGVDEYPINLNSPLNNISYFAPTETYEEFLREHRGFQEGRLSTQVTWKDVYSEVEE